MTSTYVSNPSHTLVFGGITMVDDGAEVPDVNGCVYRVKAQDTTFGNPAPVTVALLSLMRAGSLVTWDRTDNREPVLRVTLRADDSDVLAQGEKALQAECEKANTLTWIPPDGAGEASVFDIVWSQLELLFDDAAELRRERTYLVHLVALPHARPATTVVTPALGTATETVLDTGTSTTGWTAPSGAVSTSGTAVVLTKTLAVGDRQMTLLRTSLTVTGNSYLAITWSTSVAVQALTVTLPGSLVGLPEVQRITSGGGFVSYYLLPTGTTTTGQITMGTPMGATGSQTLTIDNVSAWTSLPYIGTTRQKAMSLVPGGSVRTQGSLAVSHATSALGKTIVFTHPSGTGYLPPLSPWRVSGDARTTDSTLLSGSKATLTGVTTWRVPVAALPTGRVEVWAWLTASAATDFVLNWSLFSYMGSTALSADAYTRHLTLTGWTLVFLGAATMPPVDIGPSGYVAVQMQASGGGTPLVSWDEVYLFATDLGSLTVVDCATGSPAAGGPSNRLWIDAPSPALPQGAIYRGNAADRSDQWHAGTPSTVWGDHDFDPEGTNVFVATQNALDAATSLEHYRRYHTHVARET